MKNKKNLIAFNLSAKTQRNIDSYINKSEYKKIVIVDIRGTYSKNEGNEKSIIFVKESRINRYVGIYDFIRQSNVLHFDEILFPNYGPRLIRYITLKNAKARKIMIDEGIGFVNLYSQNLTGLQVLRRSILAIFDLLVFNILPPYNFCLNLRYSFPKFHPSFRVDAHVTSRKNIKFLNEEVIRVPSVNLLPRLSSKSNEILIFSPSVNINEGQIKKIEKFLLDLEIRISFSRVVLLVRNHPTGKNDIITKFAEKLGLHVDYIDFMPTEVKSIISLSESVTEEIIEELSLIGCNSEYVYCFVEGGENSYI